MGTSYNPPIVKNGLVLNIDPANIKSYPAASDSNRANVSLLLDFDGANGSTAFVDKSLNNLTVTANGNAQISTAQSKFGGSAGSFDGNGDYLTVATATPFVFGTGDFTVELWAYFNTTTGTQGLADAAQSTTASTPSNWLLVKNSANKIEFGFHWGTALSATSTSSVSQGVWTHIAVSRSGTNLRLFINGVLEATVTNSLNITAQQLQVGVVATPSWLNGYIDDFRITKGFARYTSSFTPPGRLIEAPGRIYDLTVNKSAGTLTNGAVYNSSNGGNITFDGSNDYIKFPFNSNYNFGSGDFTVAAWINMTSLPSNNWSTFVTHGVSGSAQRWLLYYDTRTSQSSPGLRFSAVNASNAAIIDISVGNTTGWSAGVWYYVTVTRVGNVFTLYRNGIQVGNTVTDADAIVDVTSNGLYLGIENTGVDGPLNGRISLVKIYKGKGLSINEILQNYNATKGRFGL